MIHPLMIVRVDRPMPSGFSEGRCFPVAFGMACAEGESFRVKVVSADDKKLVPGRLEVGTKMGFTLEGLSVVVID